MTFRYVIHLYIAIGLFTLLTGGYLFLPKVLASQKIEKKTENRCDPVLANAPNTKLVNEPWTPPPAIFNIFGAMVSAKDRSRIHPDIIQPLDIDKLTSGTVVFLDTSEIRTPELKTSTPQSIRFEVRASSPNTLKIFNPKYGIVSLDENNISDLYGNLYRIKNFRLRSPFLPGEFVQLGWPEAERPNLESANIDLPLVNLTTGETELISKRALPWVAKFIRVLDQNEYEVIPQVNDHENNRYKVSSDHVHHLNIGSGKTLKAVLSPLKETTKSFFVGESVRFRDEAGFMHLGQIAAAHGLEFLVRSGNMQLWLPKQDIFKTWTPGQPTSIKVNASVYRFQSDSRIDLETPSGLLKEALDGAANLSSHSSFLNALFMDQLKMLTVFEFIILPWAPAGNSLEKSGLLSFSEILCSGAGICRHNTPLMAAILSEAGLEARIYYRLMGENEFDVSGSEFRGHTWLEVDSPAGQTFIIDPTNGTVKSLDDVREAASSDPNSPAAMWWANSNRRELIYLRQE